MSAMQKVEATQPITIGQLRAYLDELEAAWSSEDEKYLGSFEDQELYIASPPEGVALAYTQYLTDFGQVAIAFPVEVLKP